MKKPWCRIAIGIFVSVFVVVVAHAADISGVPTITDGDTVLIAGQSIRLDGIDAPESDQVCLDKTDAFVGCGLASRDALIKQFGGKEWICQSTGKKTYGRILATCFVDQENVNQWLFREGWAMAFVRYSPRYKPDESDAHDRCTGLWAWSFHAPWDWRRRDCKTEIRGCLSVPIDAQEKLCGPRSIPPDPKCTIKATIRGGNCIYHMEGGHYYGALSMSGSNKRWFCSEEEAQAAGCRQTKR
jgi:endonuclease YncB( thermonuclease family)